jgi:hypothetical protein
MQMLPHIRTIQRTNLITISQEEIGELLHSIGDARENIIDGYLTVAVEEALRLAAFDTLGHDRMSGLINFLREPSADSAGYVRISFDRSLSTLDEERRNSVLTAICAMFGSPLRVFDRWPLWKPIGVSFEVAPHRATGTGLNPLHVDVVNSTQPPDLVAFFCERADPKGGGQTIVANLLAAITEITPLTGEILSEIAFQEGAFYDLTGVGEEMNPFPIIDRRASPPRVRFTAKMISDVTDARARAALVEFHDVLNRGADVFLLDTAEMIILNQWAAAHGRLPLGDGQRALRLEERRLIHQCFINTVRR